MGELEGGLGGLVDRGLHLDEVVGLRLGRLEHELVPPAPTRVLLHDVRGRGRVGEG